MSDIQMHLCHCSNKQDQYYVVYLTSDTNKDPTEEGSGSTAGFVCADLLADAGPKAGTGSCK